MIMEIIFKKYDKNNKLDMYNKELAKNSKGRFEIFKSKNNKIYLLDYDECGYNRVIRTYNEIDDILSCMGMNFRIIRGEI